MWSLYTQMALIAAGVNLFLAGIVFANNPGSAINRGFALLSLILGLWNLGSFFSVISRSYFWDYLIYSAIAFVPAVSLHFTLNFIASKEIKQMRILYLCYLCSSLFALIINNFKKPYGWLWIPLLIYLFPLVLYCLHLLNQKRAKSAVKLERTQIGYILLASIVGIALGLTDLLNYLGLNIPKLGNIGAFLYTAVIAIAIIRHRLLNIGVIVSRSLFLLFLTLILWLIYVFMGFWFTKTSFTLFLQILLATLFLIIIYEPLKNIVDKLADRVLQKESYEFQGLLTRLSKEILLLTDLDQLILKVYTSLISSPRLTACAIFIASKGGNYFQQLQPPFAKDEKKLLPLTSPIIQQLANGIVNRDEIERELESWHESKRREELKSIFDEISFLDAEICIPLSYQHRLHGFIALKTSDPDSTFSERELDLLQAIASQLAIAIENARIYEDMKKRERMAAIGEMASSLAHEMRNPLGAIKSAAQLLLPFAFYPKNAEFLNIIIQETDRLNEVVSKFLDLSRPLKLNLSPTSINKIILKSLETLRLNPEFSSIEVVTHFQEDIPLINADADLLKQVFINLLTNAFQASKPDDKIFIETKWHKQIDIGSSQIKIDGMKFQSFIEISIKDYGIGIPAEYMDKLFEPFFTTKEKGIGLGLSIASKIVEHHQGKIVAESKEGAGSTFKVILPVLESINA